MDQAAQFSGCAGWRCDTAQTEKEGGRQIKMKAENRSVRADISLGGQDAGS